LKVSSNSNDSLINVMCTELLSAGKQMEAHFSPPVLLHHVLFCCLFFSISSLCCFQEVISLRWYLKWCESLCVGSYVSEWPRELAQFSGQWWRGHLEVVWARLWPALPPYKEIFAGGRANQKMLPPAEEMGREVGWGKLWSINTGMESVH